MPQAPMQPSTSRTFRHHAVETIAPPAPQDLDLDLLARIAAGSGDALGTFYDRHAAQVLGLLCRMLNDRHEAEEVLQEVFLQVWRDARRYDPQRASPRGWLLLLARSRALDRHRRTASRRRREQEEARAAVHAVAPLGTRRLEHGEDLRRIGSALDRLPHEQRRVIELAFYEGLSQTQIAERLDAPLGTVKSRALLGMRKLREMLARTEERERLQVACCG